MATETIIRNRLEDKVKEQMGGLITPTDELLKQLGNMPRKRFAHILSNNVQPTFQELWAFAEWLNCTTDELYSPQTVQSK